MAQRTAPLVVPTGRSAAAPFTRRAVKLAGLGAYLPPQRVTSGELEAELGLAPGWVEQTTGVRERRRAAGESTVGMAAQAARSALENAGLGPADVDLIVFAAVGRQQYIPCTAVFVQRELGMPEGKSFCFDVDATCLSFLVALQGVAPVVESGACRAALICSAERTGGMVDAAAPETAALFGDGAAAAVVTAAGLGEGSAIEGWAFATFSGGAELTQCPGGGTLHHPNDPATTPDMNRFQMRGRAVLIEAVRRMGPFLDAFFARLGCDRADFDRVVPHQASRMGLHQCTSRWGFRPEQLVTNLPERGNCVAASIPLALAEAVHAGEVKRGDRVLLLGTGAGLSLGAVALTF
jgi:3-oxoacyl-[acyl-carrier-protein] synthase-3